MTTYVTTFTGKPKADKGKWLYLGQVEMDSDVGFIVPDDANVAVITTNQNGSSNSDVQIFKNGAVVETVAVTNQDHVFVVDFDVVQGDLISVFNTNDDDLDDFNLTVSFVNAPPPPPADPDGPLTVRDFYLVNIAGHYINGLISAHGAKVIDFDQGTTKRDIRARFRIMAELVDALLTLRP